VRWIGYWEGVVNFFALLFIVLILINFSFSSSELNVTIKEDKDLVIRLFFKPVIFIGLVQLGNQTLFNITETQVIHTETINLGSVNVNLSNFILEILVFENSRFIQLVNYTDYYLPNSLLPGEKHFFNITYAPDRLGLHFIRVSVNFDGRKATAFGSFLVTLPPIFVPVFQPPIKQIVEIPQIVGLRPPVLQIIAPNQIDVYLSETKTLPILVRNVGERTAYNLRPFLSLPKGIDFSISPLTVSFLNPNETITYILTLIVPENLTPGIYPISFEIVSNETSSTKEIYLNVTEKPKIIDVCPDAYSRILSFEYIMVLIRTRIFSLSLKGAEVSLVNSTATKITEEINEARKLYEEGKCLEAINLLEKIRIEIENLLIEVESIVFIPRIFPTYFYLALLFSLIVIPPIIFFLIRRRKKEKKPKLLRGIKVEE